MKKTTVLIAAKDEAEHIGQTIAGVKPYVDEVIIVCDVPGDPTLRAAKEHGARVLVNTYGSHRGRAIQFGVDNVDCDVIVFMDADGSHNPKEIPDLVDPILKGTADLALSSRLKPEGSSEEFSNNWDERLHLLGNRISTWITNRICGSRITDVHYGLRAIKSNIAKELCLEEPRMTTELELFIKCWKKGVRFLELPAYEFRSQNGRSHILILQNVIDCLRCYFKYGWNARLK